MMRGRRLGGSEDNKEINLGVGSFVYVLQFIAYKQRSIDNLNLIK